MSDLDKVLYVRCTQAMLDGLDRIRDKRQRPGMVLSRASIARVLLWEALAEGETS